METAQSPEERKPPVYISTSLISGRNLPQPTLEEDLTSAVSRLMTVRLDRENICELSGLQCLGPPLHSLYLQQNVIQKIENIEFLHNLRFLTLAANNITKVENLQSLRSLRFLDLSDNQIQELDPGEFPASLVILKLTGNDCTAQEGYRELVTQALPGLRRLDGHFTDNTQDIPDVYEGEEGEKEEEEGLAIGEEDKAEDQEDDLLLEFPYSSQSIRDFFAELHRRLMDRSQQRKLEAVKEHQRRLQQALRAHQQTTRKLQETNSRHKVPRAQESQPSPDAA